MTWINLGAVLNKAKNDEGKKGISMKKFADIVGMEPSDVSRLFRGKRDIKVSTLILWSEKLGVPLKDFFDKNLSSEEMIMPRPKAGAAMYEAQVKTGAIERLRSMGKKRLKKRK